MRSVLPTFTLIAALAAPALAQPFVQEMNVITIDRRTLERYHIATVDDALRLASGFDTVRTYFKQDVTTARSILQEHYANDVLVMIDGIPTWLATTGDANLQRIDIAEVERIEFVRGPASVRFGTNAYAGAINIVLRHPAGNDVEGRVTLGTYGRFGAAAQTAFAAGGWTFSIAGRADDEDGQTVQYTDERNVTGLLREFQDARSATLSATNGRHTIFLNSFSATDSFLGSVPEFAQGMGQDQQNRGWLAGYRYDRPISSRTTFSYRASYDWNRRNFSRSLDGITRSNVEAYRLQQDVSLSWRATPSLRIDAGAAYDDRHSVEYTNENIRSGEVLFDNNMRGRSLYEGSLFADVEWTHGAWTIDGGSRLTKNQLFGSNVSGSAAAAFALTPQSSLQASARRSYRAPSLFELYFQTATNSVYGNLDLRPETSTSIDLAYARSAGPLTGKVSIYRAAYDDKIVRVRRLPNNPADRSLIYANGSQFRTSGLELDLRYAIEARTSAMLAWTWTHGDDDAVSRLRYAPEHRVTAGISVAPAPRLDLSALLTYRTGVDGPLEPIGAQTTIDINGAWTQTAGAIGIRHELSLRNAAGERITYPEYVRGVLNAIEDAHGRTLQYTARFTWKP